MQGGELRNWPRLRVAPRVLYFGALCFRASKEVGRKERWRRGALDGISRGADTLNVDRGEAPRRTCSSVLIKFDALLSGIGLI
jgi:hypothetical protein